VHREGHIGFTLFVLSIALFILNDWSNRALLFTITAVIFSPLPDVDLNFQKLPKTPLKLTTISTFVVSGLLFVFKYNFYWLTLGVAFGLALIYLMGSHRGFSHTITFATICGVFAGFVSYRIGFDFYLGFLSAFTGVTLHIIGDLMTYMPFSPFYPFYRRKFALRLFRSSNPIVNKGMLFLGIFTFVILYDGGIVIKLIVNSIR